VLLLAVCCDIFRPFCCPHFVEELLVMVGGWIVFLEAEEGWGLAEEQWGSLGAKPVLQMTALSSTAS